MLEGRTIQRQMTDCQDHKSLFGLWRLGNQLVWPGCWCCHLGLISTKMTGNINYPNLIVNTQSHSLIAKLLVLNCTSHLMNARRNRLSLASPLASEERNINYKGRRRMSPIKVSFKTSKWIWTNKCVSLFKLEFEWFCSNFSLQQQLKFPGDP